MIPADFRPSAAVAPTAGASIAHGQRMVRLQGHAPGRRQATPLLRRPDLSLHDLQRRNQALAVRMQESEVAGSRDALGQHRTRGCPSSVAVCESRAVRKQSRCSACSVRSNLLDLSPLANRHAFHQSPRSNEFDPTGPPAIRGAVSTKVHRLIKVLGAPASPLLKLKQPRRTFLVHP